MAKVYYFLFYYFSFFSLCVTIFFDIACSCHEDLPALSCTLNFWCSFSHNFWTHELLWETFSSQLVVANVLVFPSCRVFHNNSKLFCERKINWKWENERIQQQFSEEDVLSLAIFSLNFKNLQLLIWGFPYRNGTR